MRASNQTLIAAQLTYYSIDPQAAAEAATEICRLGRKHRSVGKKITHKNNIIRLNAKRSRDKLLVQAEDLMYNLSLESDCCIFVAMSGHALICEVGSFDEVPCL